MRYVALACAHQIPDLVRLYNFLSENYRPNPEAVKAALDHPATCVYYAYFRGKVVGTATLSVRAVPCYGAVGYIDDVVVDPAYRGQGFAEELMEHCLRAAGPDGWGKCRRVELTCRPGRTGAQRLYRKLGFKRRKTNVYSFDL